MLVTWLLEYNLHKLLLFILFSITNFSALSNEVNTGSPLHPQTAEYQVNFGSIELGKAKFILQPATENRSYQYIFDSNISLLMLSDIRHITSEFTIDSNNHQLLPIRYIQKREGTGKDYTEQTAFARDQGKIYTRYKDERGSFKYTSNIYDPLMVQLQLRLDLAANKENLEYSMVKKNEIDTYQFKILATEKLTIDSGSYNTIKLKVIRESNKRQTFFWIAPKLNYLPVRLTHYSNDSKQLDIKLLNFEYLATETKLTKAK